MWPSGWRWRGSGSDEITAWDALRSTLNPLPVVVLTAGLALAALGMAPRLTVALPVTVTLVGFVLSMLGPALDWPQWAMDLSPFTHIALVPAEPWAATSGIAMTAVGAALALAGLMTFHRRDLTSG